MKPGPLKQAVEGNTVTAIQQTLITYYVNDEGEVCKETVTRNFFKDDYEDSSTTEILKLK
jgi:hypothetical protein